MQDNSGFDALLKERKTMNAEEYAKARKELQELEGADWTEEGVADNAEYITHRINLLRADVFAYQHPDVDYNPHEVTYEI